MVDIADYLFRPSWGNNRGRPVETISVRIEDGRIVYSNATPLDEARALADYWRCRAEKAENKHNMAVQNIADPLPR